MLVIDHRETEPDGAMVVAPRGPLGSETAPTLGSAIDTLAREKSAFIILDAAGLEYPTDDWTWDDLQAAAEALTGRGLSPPRAPWARR